MRNKKLLAAKVLKISPKKVSFVKSALDDIKKAITRSDIRGLIAVKKIVKIKSAHTSRVRARKILAQKRKGRRQGAGTKKGKKFASVPRKQRWISKIRTQRKFLKELKEKEVITPKGYRSLYSKSGGGFFRNKRHIKLYIEEQNLANKKE
jgi:large subunit ribosomal protein L19e